jgi:hypothetical protein
VRHKEHFEWAYEVIGSLMWMADLPRGLFRVTLKGGFRP